MKMKATLAALLLAGLALNAKAQTTDEDLDAKYATSLVQPGTVAPDFTMNTPEGKILLSTVQYQKVEKLLKGINK